MTTPARPRHKTGRSLKLWERKFSPTKLTRFAVNCTTPNAESDWMASTYRRYSTLQMKDAMVLMDQGRTYPEVAKMMGIHPEAVHTWQSKRRLPKTGRYTKENYLLAMWAAKKKWLHGDGTEIECFRAACKERGMKWASVKVHMCFETVPAVPGFRVYSDPAVQMRCEAYGSGRAADSSPLALVSTGTSR